MLPPYILQFRMKNQSSLVGSCDSLSGTCRFRARLRAIIGFGDGIDDPYFDFNDEVLEISDVSDIEPEEDPFWLPLEISDSSDSDSDKGPIRPILEITNSSDSETFVI